MSEKKLDRAYAVFGMKRSGHHAIVHWIGYNLPSAMHINDVAVNRDMLLIPRHKPNPVYFGCDSSADKIMNMIYNFEDWIPRTFNIIQNCKTLSYFNTVKYILVLRDPANWLASSMKVGGGCAKNIGLRVSLYKQQIKFSEYCNDESFVHVVNYNKWISDKETRLELARNISVGDGDRGWNWLSERGGGSSFDKMKYRKNADEMRLGERWKEYKDDLDFKRLMDDEMLEINSKYFGVKLWE